MRIILASGVFDLLHPGHLYYLSQARQLGDRLIVVVTSDATCRRQNKKPLFSQTDRLQLVKALSFVDEAVIGHQGKELESILDLNPDVIAIGYNQWQDIDKLGQKLSRLGWKGEILRIGKYGAYSSSKFKGKNAK